MDEKRLRKEIDEHLANLGHIQRENYAYPSFIIKETAILQAKIAALADFAVARAEKISRRLIFLTWALLFLTAALLVFTVLLYEDTRNHPNGEKLQQDNQTQKPAAQ